MLLVVAGVVYLRPLTIRGNDLILIVILSAAGVVIGALSGLADRIWWTTGGRQPPLPESRVHPSRARHGRRRRLCLRVRAQPDRGLSDLVILAAQGFTAKPVARGHLPSGSRSDSMARRQ